MDDSNDMEALLVAYADGELDEGNVARVEAWLATNPAGQRTLAMHRETAALLRAAFPEQLYAAEAAAASPLIPETAASPDGVTPRPTATSADAAPTADAATRPPVTLIRPRRADGRPRQYGYALAVAASVLMAVIGYATGALWPGLISSDRDRMLSEVAEYHAIYSRETVHLVEVPASQSDHLKAWLGKRVNGTLVIPDFAKAGLTFAGGRLVVLDGEPVAELMYTREHGLPIAFCVLARTGKPRPVEIEARGAINLATWDDGAHSYIVVGDANAGTIEALAAEAQKQL